MYLIFINSYHLYILTEIKILFGTLFEIQKCALLINIDRKNTATLLDTANDN